MSRRYVKKSKINDLNQVVPEIVAVVSAKDNIESIATSQKYFKQNYLDAIRKIIPNFYFSDEQVISGTQVSFPNQLINSHILANKNQSTILPVSGGTDFDPHLADINTPIGFAKYFHKQQPPAQINSDDFMRDILLPLGTSYGDYTSSADFLNYISGTFLPSIPMVCAGHHETADLYELTNGVFASDSSGTYKFLADNLGWLYFLNRLGPTDGYDASSGLAELITTTLWYGRSVVLEDTINLYQEYLWRNEAVWGLSDRVIPLDYVSGTNTPSGVYTSGTQLLDRLKTLNTIVYSPHYLNSPDRKVQTAFDTYLNTSTATVDGTLITDTEEAGPLVRFLEAMSFGFADTLSEQNELSLLYDIGKCPEEFLELLGELIGWKFIGADYDKWRVQLRNATHIYKMKGTKRSIQYLLDTIFSTGIFNVTTSSTFSELWESYIPDIMYYSLATSSDTFKDFNSYTPELALQFGVPHYSPLSMDTNIKYVVDKIIFDLVREFPNDFYLGGKPFPAPELLLDGEPYIGPYNIVPNPDQTIFYPLFYTGDVKTEESVLLTLVYDPNFLFQYRGRIALVPPYEKRQYYTATQVSQNMVERIGYYLKCYGVEKNFVTQIVDYIKDNLGRSLDTEKVLNNFILFTKEKTYPPNYARVIKEVTNERTPDPLSLLSMWNGKSSHFLMNFNSSDFNWYTDQRVAASRYGITKVMRVLDQVIPAHAIPQVLLSVSDVADGLDAIGDNDCREWRPNFTNLYEGSSTVTTNFETCAVNMEYVATEEGLSPHRFKRIEVDSPNDPLLSGTGETYFAANDYTAVQRNSLRRRNYHNLLPENKMFTRGGRNNPGSLELSTSYYSSGIGYLPLGFIPSSLKFQGVAVKQNPWYYKIGTLLDTEALNGVWNVCENLSSSNAFFGYDISNTFASRAKQNVASSDCHTYGRRGMLPEILYVMNKVHDTEKYLQASSMVSGYIGETGEINSEWAVSNSLLQPANFSAWYAQDHYQGGLDVPKSMGNYLINQEAADNSLNYYEHFTFGTKVQSLYNTYLSTFSGHASNNNYDLIGGPNIFTHTYGPLIYNSNLDIDGSALAASGYLAASTTTEEVDLSYYGGSGVLSVSGMNRKGNHDLGTSAASDAGDVPLSYPEFRNRHLVSSIELVDTSTPYLFREHPVFSIFDLTRDDQSKYSYAKYLINNQIIKYHRPTGKDTLPRLRVRIDNSDPIDFARNFLEPNHDYEVIVRAHNLDISSTDIGGLSLGFWIHTDPELDQVWSYVVGDNEIPTSPEKWGGPWCSPGDRFDRWETLSVSALSGAPGINIASNRAQVRAFALGNLDNVMGSGEWGDFNSPRTEISYDYRCVNPIQFHTFIPGSNPQAIANVSKKTRETLRFKFSTRNKTLEPSPQYKGQFGKVHRLDQKYTLEFFIMKGSDTKFVVLEDIKVMDITNYNKAVIKTKYGEAQLNISDLKTVFRFFKDLSINLASRNSTFTSGIMEVSGGGRLNYRSNIQMYPNTIDSNSNFLTMVEINER